MSPAAQFCVSPDSRQSWRTAELRGAAWRGAHARLLGGFVPPGVAGAPPEAGLICVHLRSFAVPNLAFLDGAAPGLAASQAAKQVEPQMNANGGAGGGTRMVGIRTGGRGRQLRWGAECDFRARTLCNGERAGRTPMVGRGRIGRRGWQLWWGAECDFRARTLCNGERAGRTPMVGRGRTGRRGWWLWWGAECDFRATSLCKARHTRACHSRGGALTLGATRLDLSRQRGRGEKKWGAECDFHATSLCKARHTRACHSGGGALTLGAARLDLSRQRGRGVVSGRHDVGSGIISMAWQGHCSKHTAQPVHLA